VLADEPNEATLAGFADPHDWKTDDAGGTSRDLVPSWYPVAYDLATEVQHFIADYKAVHASAGDFHFWKCAASACGFTSACGISSDLIFF
jgi:hypothetical protein